MKLPKSELITAKNIHATLKDLNCVAQYSNAHNVDLIDKYVHNASIYIEAIRLDFETGYQNNLLKKIVSLLHQINSQCYGQIDCGIIKKYKKKEARGVIQTLTGPIFGEIIIFPNNVVAGDLKMSSKSNWRSTYSGELWLRWYRKKSERRVEEVWESWSQIPAFERSCFRKYVIFCAKIKKNNTLLSFFLDRTKRTHSNFIESNTSEKGKITISLLSQGIQLDSEHFDNLEKKDKLKLRNSNPFMWEWKNIYEDVSDWVLIFTRTFYSPDEVNNLYADRDVLKAQKNERRKLKEIEAREYVAGTGIPVTIDSLGRILYGSFPSWLSHSEVERKVSEYHRRMRDQSQNHENI